MTNPAPTDTPTPDRSPTFAAPAGEDDLGFGKVVAQRSRGRFIGSDGQPRSRKYGLGAQRTERLYLAALQVPWPRFFAWLMGIILLVNGIFSLMYSALGPAALASNGDMGMDDPFMRAFAYSVAVFTTNGTGEMHAVGTTAHWLVMVESVIGPLIFVVASGLLIARLTRPRAQLRFSESAVVAPYEGGRAFMFRLVNALPSQLTDLHVQVSLTWFENVQGARERNFHQLSLERSSVAFFPLHWTIVHPIDAKSPLHGITPDALRESEAEFLILISAHEETFSTQVSLRSSYTWDEVTWDAKFASIFASSPDGALAIDVDRLSRFDRLPEGATRVPAAAELV